VEHLPEYLRRANAGCSESNPSPEPLSYLMRQQIEAALEAGSLDLKAAVTRDADEIERAILTEILGRRHFTQHELCSLFKLDPKTLRAKLRKHGLKTVLGRSSSLHDPNMTILQ
jgi:DNA-binding NtrC family response regulator